MTNNYYRRQEFEKRRKYKGTTSFCNAYECPIFQNLLLENQQLKKQLAEEKKTKIENWKPTPDDLLDMLNQELLKQLKQRDEVIDEVKKLIYQSVVNLSGVHKKYNNDFINMGIELKDTIWGKELLETLTKYKGENNE